MEEEETVSILPRKELRKQKLMEYLVAKRKLKQPTPKPYLLDECQVKKPVTSAVKVVTEKENKAPADRFSCGLTKVPTLDAQSTIHPARRVCGVNNKVNVKGSIQTERQKTNCRSESSGLAQPKHNENPVSTKRYTVVSSKPKLNTVSHLKKQSNTGMKSSGRPSSNAARTAVTKSNPKFSSSANVAWSCPMRTISDRISLGPLVKTKTGLTPAVTQPSRIQSQTRTHTSATAADTTTVPTGSVANKVRFSTSLISVSKRSAMTQRKTLSITALNKPITEDTAVHLTARAGINVQTKSNSKPLLGKRSQVSCKGQLSSGLKTASISKCTAASNKPEGRVGMSKTNESNRLPADKSTKRKSEREGEKNGQQCRFAPRPSSGPASRCSSRAVNGVMRANVAEPGRKISVCKETDSRKGHSSANASAPKTGASVMSQTGPQPARTISHTGVKTAKIPVRTIPQTEGKKLTAAREERMKKLQEWREAKGISYKRPPMPAKPQVRRTVATHQPFWATMKEEDEANSLICAVDRSLADCIKLLGEGCSPDQVKAILSRLPVVSQKFAKYWICQARLMEQEGNLDVLPLFEEAVSLVLEPVDELRTVVFEILKKKDEILASDKNESEEDQVPAGEGTPESMNNPLKTPKPVRALICGEKGDSSVVKYKITATPGGPPSQQCEPARVNGQEVRFFTPVRRSVRVERASLRYPVSLRDHDLCVASYNDLMSMEDKDRREEQRGGETSPSSDNTPMYMYVYRQNEALKDKVVMQLVCDEAI